MGYYSFNLRSLLSPRTRIGFHKRLKITRGRNTSRGVCINKRLLQEDQRDKDQSLRDQTV